MSSLPGPLVTTQWLADHLDDPDLRILDCSALPGSTDENGDIVFDGGRANWDQGHIPNSAYADIRADLSDPDAEHSFTIASPQRFAKAMEALGVGEGISVVLYDADLSVHAARLWWELRRYGFDDAAILDGGWTAWTAEERPTSTEPAPERPPARFVVNERPELEADRDEVLAALEDPAVVVVDSVPYDEYLGGSKAPWNARPGHIEGATNLSGRDAVDESGRFPLEELRAKVEALDLDDDARVITYCGVGVAAAGTAFVLHLFGHEDVALYDGSLQEWSYDPALPMSVEPEG